MPDALELPRMLRPVIPLMSCERRRSGVVDEFIALALGHSARSCLLAGRRSRLVPRFAAIVRTLNDLPEPAAGLRGINSIRIYGRSLQVIEFPPGKVRAADLPVLAFAVCRKNECAFASAHQDSDFAHELFLS